ncbi:Torsin domain containing protein, partial [Asbolus verrucosus]
LEDILQKRLYGQHLVQDIVVNAIRSHWSNNSKPQKALALSLRGTPGSGKTYVTNFIKENLYASGHKSNFVNHFNARNDFASKKNIDEYEEDIHMKIERKVTQCPKQLFIFDESDLIPPQLLDKLKFMIDYNVDYTQSIFIFLSHIGGELINDHYFYLLKEANKTREDLKLADFYTLISKEAFFKEDNDFYNSLVKTFLIDHYVPFLPMERRHVRQCIVDEFLRRNIMNPKEEYINKILEIVQWVPLNEKVFSRSGCKQISQQNIGSTS